MKLSEQLQAHANELGYIAGMIPQDTGYFRLKDAQGRAIAAVAGLQEAEGQADTMAADLAALEAENASLRTQAARAAALEAQVAQLQAQLAPPAPVDAQGDVL